MLETLPPIQLGAPGKDISIRDLRAISERFKKLHHLKRESIRHILNSTQRLFLDALPLIFNANHPALPGFISSTTPAGIFSYLPDKRAIDAARQINQSFNYHQRSRDKNNDEAIDGLFLMGSVGSIAFTKASDIDIWLCHRADLTRQELDELQKKTNAIEDWAASLHLEVHFFLINSKQFILAQKTPVSADSSGETQHYLLLEEFYRTSVYIAGKDLAWWLVPPEYEYDYQNYLAHLLERRFICENQILDLGGLAHVPAAEFISATQWHIYKALHSPYKSLMKLLLMECYASEYPHTDWLCTDIKLAVHQGKLTGLEIDPYVLVYRKLEDYLLKSQSPERLAMIRQIFYRKIFEAAGDQRQIGTVSPYKRYFHEITENWKWPKNLRNALRDENARDAENILTENSVIVEQLTGCHYKILKFAHDHIDPDFQESDDMKLLAKKLRAFFERKNGKIEIMTIRVAGLPLKPELSISENPFVEPNTDWLLCFDNKNQLPTSPRKPLYRRSTLIEMLCWLSINGFYRQGAPVHSLVQSFNLTTGELNKILDRLDTFFKSHFDFSDSLSNYEGDNSLVHSLMFINIGQTQQETEAIPYVFSHRSNPLSYAARRECLVRTIDRVSISHWNEVLSSHGQGIEGLLNCLIDLVNSTVQPKTADCLTIICQMPGYAQNIITRIEQLFAALLELRRQDPDNPAPRYLMAGGDRYFIFSKQDTQLQYRQIDNETQLIKALAGPRTLYGSVAFDPEVLAQTPIPTIYQENRPYAVQCFIYQEINGIKVYILDEKGSLSIRQHHDAIPDQLVRQYARFLYSVLSRKNTETTTIQFFEIKKNAAGVWSTLPVSFQLPEDNETKLIGKR